MFDLTGDNLGYPNMTIPSG